MKYVVHYSNFAGQVGNDYLTPTQRAQRQIRRLKELLGSARQNLEQKDSEIMRLTREVVELRLFKASLSSPDERSASSDAVTVREADLKTSQDVSPIVDMIDEGVKVGGPGHLHHLHHHHHHGQHQHHQEQGMMLRQHILQESMGDVMISSTDMQSSFADSGHFEDMTLSSLHSKEDSSSYTAPQLHDQACGSDEEALADCEASAISQFEEQRQELIRMYEQRIEDLVRNQDAANGELKRSNNDRIEALLQKLAECNSRYADIVPDYEQAKERIRELEKQLDDLQRKLASYEQKQKQMYLHMYQQGQDVEDAAPSDQVNAVKFIYAFIILLLLFFFQRI